MCWLYIVFHNFFEVNDHIMASVVLNSPQMDVRGQLVGLSALQYAGSAKVLSGKGIVWFLHELTL